MTYNLRNNTTYKNWLSDIKNKIRLAQLKAAVKVNTELLNLYWQLGKEIIEKQNQSNWGDALIEQMAKDLSFEFKEMKGFSKTNLFYIKRWYLFYQQPKVPQLVAQLKGKKRVSKKVPQPVAQLKGKKSVSKKVPQLVAQLERKKSASTKVPQLVAQIPWGHNREIISKCSNVEEALFYVKETIRNNWSRSVLLTQIESKLYKRKGKVLHNFENTLPKPQADLAIEVLKNPYNFDFLTFGLQVTERDLEHELTSQITKFLLELGQGFAFIGKQYQINVGGRDFHIDLLFYHTKLRCYVVVELKIREFEPEFAGKLNFYLNAVDAQIKHSNDQPSIGILLCKTPNKVVVEYSLKNIRNPLGVAEYQFTHAIPDNLKSELPSIKALEDELTKQLELKRQAS